MTSVQKIKVLFVCSMNRWRSPTAEKVFADRPFLSTRSAGTSKNAAKTINAKDIRWADVVMVMEKKHLQKLRSDFPGVTRYKNICVLDIPDNYQFMDPELIDEIVLAVEPELEKLKNDSANT